MKYRVITSRKTEFENPIKLTKDERVLVLEESNQNGDWANWVNCRSSNNEGWVPRQILNPYSALGVETSVTEDYDATEFDLEVDEILIMQKELNGWIWCYKDGNPNKMGWAPLNCIEILDT